MEKEKNSIFVANTDVCKNFAYISELEIYAKNREIQLFVLSAPLIDAKYTSDYKKGLILASPGHKILFVSLDNDTENDDFQDYIIDTLEDIGSISDRYHFKGKIGRPRHWREKAIAEINCNDIARDNNILDNYAIDDPTEVRRVNIIISFLIGSINSAANIDVEAPINILESVKQKIQLFDSDQTRFIYDEVAKEKKTIRIQGLSGTGKTELLLHKLKDIYINNKTDIVAFTCYSKVLAHSLRKRIPDFFDSMNVQQQIAWDDRLFCFNAWGQQYDANSGVYSYICTKYDISFYAYKYNPNFETVCKKAIEDIQQKKEHDPEKFKYAFQYLFIDESQDFGPYFFKLCELVTEKRVFAAGDIFQDIYETLGDTEKVERDYLLSRCYRTDPKLFMIAQGLGWGLFESEKLRWLSDGAWEACGYKVSIENETRYKLSREHLLRFDNFQDPGVCFNTIFSDDISNTSRDVIYIIQHLKREFNEITPNDICVIYIDDDQYVYNSIPLLKQQLYNKLQWDVNVAYETKKKIDNTLFVSNRRHAKGLEFPFVICITKQISNSITYRNSLYTMLSRAFLRTYMIMPKSYQQIYQEQFESGIDCVLKDGLIITEKPTIEQENAMNKRLLEFKQTRSWQERISAALLTLGLPEDNTSKVVEFAKQSKNNLGDDDDLKKFIEQLAKLGLIDE